jgi:membrane fusion protein, copper/silver efflux system
MTCNSRENQNSTQHTQHDQMEMPERDTTKMPDEHSGHNQQIKDAINTDTSTHSEHDIPLNLLLKPTNEFVITTIPVTSLKKDKVPITIEALGKVEYDTRMIGTIAARVSGRIEKLYVRYKYQPIQKGQKIMDIYSPELLTAQQNLIFLLTNDTANTTLIQAAKDRLLLLGMSSEQLNNISQTKEPLLSVSIYSNYKGHLHDATDKTSTMSQQINLSAMGSINPQTELLDLKEGMYVQSGQNLFSVYNPARAWASLNIYTDKQALIKKGQNLTITPETAPLHTFKGRIDFIEPFYRKESATTTIRVYFDNARLQLPIGSPVRGLITTQTDSTYWLPTEAVLSLGLTKIVFLKQTEGFRAKKITTGISLNNTIQVLSGLSDKDSVAVNAGFLIDSESFIKND